MQRREVSLHVFKFDVYTDSEWAGAADSHSQSSMFIEREDGPLFSS